MPKERNVYADIKLTAWSTVEQPVRIPEPESVWATFPHIPPKSVLYLKSVLNYNMLVYSSVEIAA